MKLATRRRPSIFSNFKRLSLIALALIMTLSGLSFNDLSTNTVTATGAGLNLHAPYSKDPAINPNGTSLTEGNPHETNFSPISISGTPVGIDPSTISYRITKVGTTQMQDDAPSPLISGDDFTFPSVNLFAGLNKIELYGNIGGSITTMEERFVYFSNSPSLYNLEVIDQTNIPVVNFSPPASDPFKQSTFDRVMRITNFPIAIQGNVLNTNEVLVQGETAAIFGNQFVIETSNIGLFKGDYDLTFTARNDTSQMQYPYNVAFNNGQPLMLDVKANLNNSGGAQPSKVKLNQLKEVTLDKKFANSSNTVQDDVYLSGYLFIDNQASFGELRVSLLHISDVTTEVANTTVTLADLNALPSTKKITTSKYSAYNLEEIALDSLASFEIHQNPGKYKLVFETYDTQNPMVRHQDKQEYRFTYVNENLPYIHSVKQNGVSLTDNKLITRAGQEIVVAVGGTTTNVTLESTILSTPYSPATIAPVRTGNNFVFKLDNLQPGNQTFTFTASDGGGQTSTEIFYVEVILTPTVRLYNVNSDQIFNTKSIPNIVVDYVNVNAADRGKTEITLNGVPEANPYNAANSRFTIRNTDGTFCSTNDCLLKEKFSISINSTSIIEGRNELKFKLVSGQTISEYTLVFYYLATDAPFIDMKPVPTSDFKGGGLTNQYTTTRQLADFEGTLTNAKYIVVRRDGVIVAEQELVGSTWQNKLASPATILSIQPGTSVTNWKVNTYNNNLISTNVDGTFNFNATIVFSFEIYKETKNQAPLSINSVTISRLPAAYDPTPLTKQFLDRGVINRNYLPFTIDTDGAIAVSVNKLPMENLGNVVGNRTRFHLDVPLKSGKNSLKIDLEYPGSSIKETITITSSNVIQSGGAQKNSLGKNIKFKMFNNDLELTFPKGTLIKQANPTDGFAQLYNEVPLFFGIANSTNGLVIEENSSNVAAINLMQSRLRVPDRYAIASMVFWIDAGQIEFDQSVKGGTAPYTLSSFERIHNRTDLKRLVPSQQGTLTLNYDQRLRIAASHLLTVMYHDGQQWRNLGGVVNSKKGTITVPFRDFGYYTVMRLDKTFNDVSGHAWARDDIEILKARGWMREISPNQFGTSSLATRGELATMLIKALELPLDYEGTMSFADVPRFSSDPNQLWDYRYIETAARVGIIRGGNNNLFRPADVISRQDTAIMIARAMNLKLSDYERAQRSLERKFTDSAFISLYATASVEAVEKKGIMTGKAGVEGTLRFDPLASLNRAELATMTVRMMKDLKRIE